MNKSVPKTRTNLLTFPIFLIMSIALTSCTEVMWENPISPVEDTVGDTRLPGAWKLKNPETDTITHVLFIGKPVDGWMSFCIWMYEQGKITKGFGKMFVSKIDRRTFLNVRLVEDNGNLSDFYCIVEYRIHKKKLWLYYPEGDFVENAIEGKEISAQKIKDKGFLIRSSSEEIREFIRRSPKEKLFGKLLDRPGYLEKR